MTYVISVNAVYTNLRADSMQKAVYILSLNVKEGVSTPSAPAW